MALRPPSDVTDALTQLFSRGANVSELVRFARDGESATLSKTLRDLGFATLGQRKRMEQALRACDAERLASVYVAAPATEHVATQDDVPTPDDEDVLLEANNDAVPLEEGDDDEAPVLEVNGAMPAAERDWSASPDAAACKQAGNRAFADGDLVAAIEAYRRGLDVLGPAAESDDELTSMLWSNLARARLESTQRAEAAWNSSQPRRPHSSQPRRPHSSQPRRPHSLQPRDPCSSTRAQSATSIEANGGRRRSHATTRAAASSPL
jgi:hypothetical protein